MAAKQTLPSFLTNLLLIFIHTGCFLFVASDPTRTRKKHKSPIELLSASWSLLMRVFSFNGRHVAATLHSNDFHFDEEPPNKRRTGPRSESEYPLFPLRNGIIFPCSACGEVFQRQSLLDQHNSTEHAVSELREGDPSKNVVWIIFNSGWKDSRPPRIDRILKIHNSPKTLARFEEYREFVKARAAAADRNDAVWRRNERCVVDGNELLRFHCTTFVCDLGQNGKSALCGQQFCSVCGVIRGGFSSKLDGIATLATGWNAHVAVPDDVEDEFSFMSVKRAMLVCRVVAGRVGCDQAVRADKSDPGFDSVASSGGLIGEGSVRSDGEDELLVFNPRAVLPCFVIVYSV